MISFHHFITATIAASILSTGVFTAELAAQTPAPTPAQPTSNAPVNSLTDALSLAFDTDHRLAILAENAAQPGNILSIEILGSKLTALVEIEIIHGDKKFRYPLKFGRNTTSSHWQIYWTPDEAYTKALLSITHATEFLQPNAPILTSSNATTPWTDQTRIPAFPVIATQSSIITPFGIIHSAKDLSDLAAPLTPPDDLVRHTTRWITQILEDAPAPAAIDLILDARLPWKAATRLIMATSANGLFRTNVITNNQGAITTIPLNAPVFDPQQLPDHIKMLTVGIYPLPAKKIGFRIAYNNEILQIPHECPTEMSFCTENITELPQKLQELTQAFAQTQQATHIMFAAPKNASFQTAIDYLQATIHTLQIPPEKTFIGFIQ